MTTPYVRSYEKTPRVRDRGLCKRFAQDNAFCFACGIPEEQARRERWPGLAVHHLLGGACRSDELPNLLVLCQRDHDLRHGACLRVNGEPLPGLTLGMTLTMKRRADPDNYDPGRLEALWKRALPDAEELPDFLLAEWARRRRSYGGRCHDH